MGKWREDQRGEIGKESACGVFEKLAQEMGEDDVADWEKLTKELGKWSSEEFEEERIIARNRRITDQETEDEEDEEPTPKIKKENDSVHWRYMTEDTETRVYSSYDVINL